MKNFMKKTLSIAAAGILLLTQAPQLNLNAYAQGDDILTLNIDGSTAETKTNKSYRGLGMVSGNNTSRLLLDYKAQNPDEYWDIMNYIFGKDGLNMAHLKVEMGADINSSSGTEPSVMRSEDEDANVTRGVAYQLACDAKTINPDLTLDMLWWSEPAWVSNASDVNSARYKWYKSTLDAAYEKYGLEFEYVSANQNERGVDAEWIKYLSAHLKNENDSPYDYSKIKIVAADEVGSWGIADEMVEDEELLNAVDVIGGHYNDWASDNVKKLCDEYGKEVWFSEGCPSMSYSQGTYRYDETGSGLNDLNGLLDVANRIITMYPEGDMTLYEFQPVIASYYAGSTYTQKQLILADEPWSGYYTLDNGFYMGLHFSQFFDKGWEFVNSACAGDGSAGGDGHSIVDAHYSYMTACSSDRGDYSTIITNTTADTITYNVEVSNLDKAGSDVDVWETRGPDENGEYNENYFKKIDTISPVENGGKYTYSVTVKPYSLVTISTKQVEEKEFITPDKTQEMVLSLPYEDDYEYTDYDESFLSQRGNAPLYTTDEGGAFEVVNKDGNNVLMQIITKDTRANEWGGQHQPVTNFGDDSWFNYSMSVDITFADSGSPDDNYVGAGIRYNLGDAGESGYWFKLYESGKWELKKSSQTITAGTLEGFDSKASANVKVEAIDNLLTAYVNGEVVAQYDANIFADGVLTGKESVQGAGRCALYSEYYQNCFDNVKVEKAGDNGNYICRNDDTDSTVSYTGAWTHTTMGSFKSWHRTSSETDEAGATAEISFSGTGVNVIGAVAEDTAIKVELDGKVVEESYAVPKTENREANYYIYGLESGEHTLKITLLSGKYSIDAFEAKGDFVYKDMTSYAGETKALSENANKSNEKKSNMAIPIAIAGGAVCALAVIGGIIYKVKKSKKQ